MKIKHYLYNTFIIESGDYKLAIDPGRDLWWAKLNSLIPNEEWNDVTHIFTTHGDPDHFDYAVKMAEQSDAVVVCHDELVDRFTSDKISAVHSLGVGEHLELDSIRVKGLKTKHGPLPVKLGGGLLSMRMEVLENNRGGQEVYLMGKCLQSTHEPMEVFNHGTIKLLWGLLRLEKDNIEDFARGVIGFQINIGDKSIVNLGDSLLQDGWKDLRPDVLMLPIGGSIGNTMDMEQALEAVQMIRPKHVIPCHYKGSFLWKRNINPADDKWFKAGVENMDIPCHIMNYGDEITL